MEKALEIQKKVIEILGTDEVYLVGGSVRDIVMGNKAKDYDFTTPMLPEEMEERVKAAGRKVYGIGKNFGTIGFKVPVEVPKPPLTDDSPNHAWMEQNEPMTAYEYVEVTTFRSEVYTGKSRHPEVKFVPSLEEDLARRDFTMNAMVLRPDGTIYDPYHGKLDIHAKQIVTVGLPKERIMEDPLRMLRAARFAARYGFSIDPNFIGKARQLADRIYDVSVERWVQELDKLLTSHYMDNGITELFHMGLLERILPEFMSAGDLIRGIGEEVTDDPDQMWRLALQGVDENRRTARYINSGICARLKFSNDRRDLILDNRKK